MLPKTGSIWILFAAWPLLGMFCHDPSGPLPGLPAAHLTDIHLVILDPSTSTKGYSLSWSYPESAQVSNFQIFATFDPDTLGAPALVTPGDSLHALLPLADSSAPYTLFFAVRAVFVEPTGQKQYGDTLPVDSLAVNGPATIQHPARGDTVAGRQFTPDVLVTSTTGVTLRQSYFEDRGAGWIAVIDTCLPRDDCSTPIIGTAVVKDTLVLSDAAPGASYPALFCVQGTENFEGRRTGLTQSLGCSSFRRAGP